MVVEIAEMEVVGSAAERGRGMLLLRAFPPPDLRGEELLGRCADAGVGLALLLGGFWRSVCECLRRGERSKATAEFGEGPTKKERSET